MLDAESVLAHLLLDAWTNGPVRVKVSVRRPRQHLWGARVSPMARLWRGRSLLLREAAAAPGMSRPASLSEIFPPEFNS